MATFKDYLENAATQQRVLTKYYFFLTQEERNTFDEHLSTKHCPDCKNRKIDRIFCQTCDGKGSVKYLAITDNINKMYERVVKEYLQEEAEEE